MFYKDNKWICSNSCVYLSKPLFFLPGGMGRSSGSIPFLLIDLTPHLTPPRHSQKPNDQIDLRLKTLSPPFFNTVLLLSPLLLLPSLTRAGKNTKRSPPNSHNEHSNTQIFQTRNTATDRPVSRLRTLRSPAKRRLPADG